MKVVDHTIERFGEQSDPDLFNTLCKIEAAFHPELEDATAYLPKVKAKRERPACQCDWYGCAECHPENVGGQV